ncbi:hypothetical protein IWQ61_001301 [Dispira simplex]|nr:hypothetical protein IWQ61_001301 [Dispira simplex]
MGTIFNGPLCNGKKHPLPTLLQLGTGNQHQQLRCIPPVVAKGKRVFLSTMEPGEKSSESGPTGQLITDPDHPIVAKPTVVALSSTHGNSTTMVDSTTRDTIDRVVDIRICLENQEMPTNVSSTILEGLQPTTLRQYKYAWNTGSWCGKQQIDHLQPTASTLLRFLDFLGDQKQQQCGAHEVTLAMFYSKTLSSNHPLTKWNY